MRYASLADRVLANIRREPGGCWVWQSELNTNGYGRLELSPRPNRKRVLAHRLSYELFVGPIPGGLPLDHLCRNPPCVNPEHLEPVTHRENLLRGETLAAANRAKTHCKHGHEFTPENTYLEERPSGYPARKCRTCQRAKWRRWKDRQALRAAAVPTAA